MDTKDAGRLGGKSKSEKKAAAARANGQKGGKPKVIQTSKECIDGKWQMVEFIQTRDGIKTRIVKKAS